MSPIPTKHLDGDVAVARNANIGGDASVKGNMRVEHGLRVDGWLDAPNIKGPNKGVFNSVSDLYQAYPRPSAGWYAIVGSTLNGDLYVGKDGKWNSTGTQWEGPTLDVAEYNRQLTELRQTVQAHLDAYELVAANLKDYAYPTIEANKQKLVALQQQLEALVGGDVSDAIDNYNEIVAFLEGFKDDATLAPLLKGISDETAGAKNDIAELSETLAAHIKAYELVAANLTNYAYPAIEANKEAIKANKEAIEGEIERVEAETVKVYEFDGVVEDMAHKPESGIYYIKADRRFYDCENDDYVIDLNGESGQMAREDAFYRLRNFNYLYRFFDPEGLFRLVDEDDLRTAGEDAAADARLLAVVDQFKAAAGDFGRYDPAGAPDAEHPFYWNELWLTADEVLQVVVNGKCDFATFGQLSTNSSLFKSFKLRTNWISPMGMGSDAVRTKLTLDHFAYGNAYLETILLHPNDDPEKTVGSNYYGITPLSLYNAFRSCGSLKTVRGCIYLDKVTSVGKIFEACRQLEDFTLVRLKCNINLGDVPLMSTRSAETLVNYAANTEPITITVHPDVYAKMDVEQKWMDLVDAAAAKQITFATTA